MAVLPIQITGEPVLHTLALPVTRFDDELRALVNDMLETMALAPGVGLAATQVGIGLRLFVFNWEDDDGVLWRGEAINPELWISPVPIGAADEEEESEGCLSVPGERFPLRRAELAILKAVNLEGVPFEIRAEGWLARIFQHEYDHLDGLLYVDRLEHAHSKMATKAVKRNGWGKPGMSWMPGVDNLEED
jgi:peptide deformylase